MADGSELTQLTHLSADNPVPAWSPDGKWIAIARETGLYVVDAAGVQTSRLSFDLSTGIDWLE